MSDVDAYSDSSQESQRNNSQKVAGNDSTEWREISASISGGQKWVEHFRYNNGLKKSKCVLCDKLYNGCFLHNLKRHLCKDHVQDAAIAKCSIKRKRSTQDNMSSKSKRKKDGKLSRADYIMNCVLLAAVNMVAFLLFNSQFFRNLVLIHATNTKTTINSSNIGIFIQQTERQIRKLIANEVKNRLVSIKLDIATRHHRSMLCVNVQYYCPNRKKIVIRTLGCVELRRAHKSSYLEQRVYAILALYDIDRLNIYCYTSDNGANLLRLGKLIQNMQRGLSLSQKWEEFIDRSGSESQNSDSEMEPADVDQDFQFDYEMNMHAGIRAKTINNLMTKLTSKEQQSPMALLEVFGCAAHTVQLAVHDVLTKVTRTSIVHIRSVIKELRSSKYLDYGSSALKSLKLNVCSRWNSLYLMFASILKRRVDLEELYERVPKTILTDIYLSSDDFQYMTEFNEAFEPIYKLTLALQAEQLAMSDVVILWFKCKRSLNKLDSTKNEFVQPLIQAFDKRTEQIMGNPLIAAAAYVDPRLNHKTRSSDFLGEAKDVAEARILLVVKRITEISDVQANQHVDESIADEDLDDQDLDQFIELETARFATKLREKSVKDDKKLMDKIRELGIQDKLKMKSNIFGYYEQLKKQGKIDSIMFDTVMTILSAPATQVSVERTFSALALLLEDIRCNLGSTTIDNILKISLNRELVNYVKMQGKI